MRILTTILNIVAFAFEVKFKPAQRTPPEDPRLDPLDDEKKTKGPRGVKSKSVALRNHIEPEP